MGKKLGKNEVLLMNAGSRERQTAFVWWNEQPFSTPGRGYYPFQTMIEESVYNASRDTVTVPLGKESARGVQDFVTFKINDWYGKVLEYA